MRQRKLGSHTPPCHRRMVITTLFSVFLAALQRRPVLYHTRWLLSVLWLWSSGHSFSGHEATETGLAYAPVSQAHGHNHIVQCLACCTAA